MYNPYNNQMYMQDLQGLRDRIDRQMQMANQNQPQATPITQNFQLAPNQNNGIKYVNSIEDVRKELVFADTLFVNKEYTQLWVKNASGEVKTYELKGIIELDEKDRKIADLEAKINMLVKEKENEQYVNENANGTTSSKKSTNGKSNKSSNE
jgi:hypothetical protein|nr:MAG TPA: PRKC APOPTOSIS WT1 REGULATOR PROTEIN [Caudoviricetes sp.]